MVDNKCKNSDNEYMEKEVTSQARIKVYDAAVLACDMDLTAAMILSAIIGMKRQVVGRDTTSASIKEIRESIVNSASKPTVIKKISKLHDLGLITKHSAQFEKGEFTIHYDEILKKAKAYTHTT